MNESIPLVDKPTTNTSKKPMRYLPASQKLAIFNNLVDEACEAIEQGVEPALILAGSSGSYFVYNKDRKIIGVFKPKNEEPYGKMNPKWLKWMHRICFPCLFGRSCILPNRGYISEAAAYIVDSHFCLNLVPPTFVTSLASANFNYSKMARNMFKFRKNFLSKFTHKVHNVACRLPPKIGSFQKFAPNCMNGYSFLQKAENKEFPKEVMKKFQLLFEKLAILDYIIRNTDRGDNWLIFYEPEVENVEQVFSRNPDDVGWSLRLFAIDNGLAFPFKHPDSWRSYPYHWLHFDQAKVPFSASIRAALLPILEDSLGIRQLEDKITSLHQIDPSFDNVTFQKQLALFRGQLLNLTSTLKTEKSTPYSLVSSAPLYVLKDNSQDGQFKKIRPNKAPFFNSF